MKGHMTLSAEGSTVRNVVAQVGILGVGLDMVRRQAALALPALATTLQADVAVALQHGFAPGEILRAFEALPEAAAFPERMSRAFQKRTSLYFGLKDLFLRFIGYPPPFCFGGYLGP